MVEADFQKPLACHLSLSPASSRSAALLALHYSTCPSPFECSSVFRIYHYALPAYIFSQLSLGEESTAGTVNAKRKDPKPRSLPGGLTLRRTFGLLMRLRFGTYKLPMEEQKAMLVEEARWCSMSTIYPWKGTATKSRCLVIPTLSVYAINIGGTQTADSLESLKANLTFQILETQSEYPVRGYGVLHPRVHLHGIGLSSKTPRWERTREW